MSEDGAEALLAAALIGVDDFYARVFRDWPTAVTRRAGACTLAYSGDPHLNGANHLFPHTPQAITGAILNEAEQFFAAYSAAWTVIYTDRFAPQAADLLAARGYRPRWSSSLMVLAGAPQPVRAAEFALVERARTREDLDDVVRVMIDAFGTSPIAARRLVRPAHADDPALLHYLVRVGRTPVSCATIAVHTNGIASVWNVATRLAFRRRGYAGAVMLAALADLRARGITTTVLLASREGVPLYERLGYVTLATTHYMGIGPALMLE